MGTFGPGNFDNDQALDVLETVKGVIDSEIDGFLTSNRVGIIDLEPILACIAIKNALIAQCQMEPPTTDEVQSIREKIIRIFDREIGTLNPVEGYVEKRRQIIVDTLDKLLSLATEI